jgi:UDP-N-acetylmuramoylalanine--D-glutamate ligase
LVKEVGSVKYYDDSFGTTPETAIVALQAVDEPKVLILGGSDKGALFEELTGEVIKQNVRHVITIGKTGPAIAALLRQKGYDKITEDLDTMPAIVKEAKRHAKKGDAVLLSTGCASFGLFKDYKDRGNQFKEAVAKLS